MKTYLLFLSASVSAQEQCLKPTLDQTGDDAQVRCADVIDHSAECIVKCLPGFVVEGTASTQQDLVCDNGSFDKEVKKCVCETCCDKTYENVENASFDCSDENQKKSLCTINCDPGYTLVGSNDPVKCTNNKTWSKQFPICISDDPEPTTTTAEPPTTMTDFDLDSWLTPNFGFDIVEAHPDDGRHRVAWNQGLYVDDNGDVQFGGSVSNGFPGVRRQWLRYTDVETGKRNKIHFEPTEFGYELEVPDFTKSYRLELMVKFHNGMVFADTKFTVPGELTTTTEEQTTTTTTSTTTTTTTTTPTTTEPETTTSFVYNQNINVMIAQDGKTETSLKLVWNQNTSRNIDKQWIRYRDQFGAKKIVQTNINQTQRQVSGLTPGYEYTFEVIQTYPNGEQDFASVSARMNSSSSNGGGAKCVVCNSADSNDSCNTEGLSCDVAQNQMCQTIVRVSNGLPPKFEKRCKQRQACLNEENIYKKHGMCAGGDRSQLVDVCVYCCEGDYCNVAGSWMDTLVP